MKQHEPTPGMWMAYVAQIKDELGRDMSEAEVKLALQAYMSKKPAIDFVEELPE